MGMELKEKIENAKTGEPWLTEGMSEEEIRENRDAAVREIRFYIPGDLTIPTDLRLKVGDIDVEYERIPGGFKFIVFVSDQDVAMAVVERIIIKMKYEHDEPQHGVSWRTVSTTIVSDENDYYTSIEWKYRVRDSY